MTLNEHHKPESKDGGRKQFGDKGQIASVGRIEVHAMYSAFTVSDLNNEREKWVFSTLTLPPSNPGEWHQ